MLSPIRAKTPNMSGPVQSEDLRSILMTKDDLLHCFYIFLWSKAPNGMGVQGVRIPDTVILNHSRVLEYYFSSKEGCIKRKSRANLVTAHLLEQLEKHDKKCQASGIVAMMLNRDPKAPSGIDIRPCQMSTLKQRLVEGNVGSGTLQFFVEPKKEGAVAQNACLGVQWTPNLTYTEKRTNVFAISAPSSVASLESKTTLEDGSTNVRIAHTVSSRVAAEIERMCRAIFDHFLLVFKARITHMGLEFKVDSKEQTWLTYCYSLKLADENSPTKPLHSLQLREKESSNRDGDERDASGLNQTGKAIRSDSRTSRNSQGGNGRSRSVNSQPGRASMVRCCVCATQEIAVPSTVTRQNILFPLALLSFFCTHPPGTEFQDDEKIEAPTAVPEYVQMLHENEHSGPTMSFSPSDELAQRPSHMALRDYMAVRKDPVWLNTPLHCCRGCTEELRVLVEDLQISEDGKIRVPGNPIVAPLDAPKVGLFSKTTAAQRARIEAGKALPAPKKQISASPYAENLLHHATPKPKGTTNRTSPTPSLDNRGSLPPLAPSRRASADTTLRNSTTM